MLFRVEHRMDIFVTCRSGKVDQILERVPQTPRSYSDRITDYPMNGAEAAASLFGSDDSSSDPFASLGADDVTSSSGDVFRGNNAHGAEVQDPFAMPNGSNEVQTLLSDESLSHRNMPTQHDSFQLTDHYGSSGVVGQQSQNWYGTEGHGSVAVQQTHHGTRFV